MSYVKSNLNYKVCSTLMNDASAENWLEIGTHRNKWQIGVFYREFKKFGEPNSGTYEEQVQRLDNFLTKAEFSAAKGNCVLIGDFNINLDPENTENQYHNEEFKDKLLDTLPLAGYTQLVRNNTRHRIGNKSTLIDHSWTNRVNKHVQTRNIDSDSDHDIILTTVLTNGNVSTKEATKRRNYHKFEAENYLADLMGQKWSQVYNFTDPTLIEDKITELLLYVLDWYAPLKYKPKKKVMEVSNYLLNVWN